MGNPDLSRADQVVAGRNAAVTWPICACFKYLYGAWADGRERLRVKRQHEAQRAKLAKLPVAILTADDLGTQESHYNTEVECDQYREPSMAIAIVTSKTLAMALASWTL